MIHPVVTRKAMLVLIRDFAVFVMDLDRKDQVPEAFRKAAGGLCFRAGAIMGKLTPRRPLAGFREVASRRSAGSRRRRRPTGSRAKS